MVADSKFHYKNGRKAAADLNDLLQLARKFPIIAHLCIGWFILIKIEDTITFIRHLKALKTFQFQIGGRSQYNRLVNLLDATLDDDSHYQRKYFEDHTNKHIIPWQLQ